MYLINGVIRIYIFINSYIIIIKIYFFVNSSNTVSRFAFRRHWRRAIRRRARGRSAALSRRRSRAAQHAQHHSAARLSRRRLCSGPGSHVRTQSRHDGMERHDDKGACENNTQIAHIRVLCHANADAAGATRVPSIARTRGKHPKGSCALKD